MLLGKYDKGGKRVQTSILLPEEANWMHVNFQLGGHTRGKRKREEMQSVIAAMRKQQQH